MACAIDNDAVVKLSYHAGKAAIGGGLVFAEVKAELLAQFKQRPPPPALFARDGLFAYAAIQALAELGIKCPDDISITCVGRYYEGVFDMPHITSAQSVEGAQGREVVLLAAELVNGRRTGPLGIVLPMQMVEGETTRFAHSSYKK
jgi:LacI family transcriptional regulator